MADLVRGAPAKGAPSPPPAPAEESKPDAETPREAAEATPPAAAVSAAAPEPAPEPPAPTHLRLRNLVAIQEPVRRVESPPVAAPAAGPAPEDGAGAAERLFKDLQGFLEGVRDLVRKRSDTVPWHDLERLVERVIDALAAAGELFWVANRPLVPAGVDYLAFHQARVAVLSIQIGASTGYSRRDLVMLGMAGCLIDVALWQLGPGVLRRLDALSAEEQAQYRAHPRLAADMIRHWAPPVEGLVEAVLEHHERENGQGFPQGLQGAVITGPAQILGLVDTYTGLTAPASTRPGLRPHEAIREIVRSRHEAFPPALIKALLSEISVFPPGTLVRLNTGDVGCVVAVNRNHPLRPRVEVYDSKGRRLPAPKMIDLSEAPFIYITGPVSEGAR